VRGGRLGWERNSGDCSVRTRRPRQACHELVVAMGGTCGVLVGFREGGGDVCAIPATLYDKMDRDLDAGMYCTCTCSLEQCG